MRASSNNHYHQSLPFIDTQIHSNKISEGDTGYDSLSKQQRITNTTVLSSTSLSSNNQLKQILSIIKKLSSTTDISTTPNTSDLTLSAAQRIAQFSQPLQSTPVTRKLNRTRIQPIPDSTSDSAESFALSNDLILVSSDQDENNPPFGGELEYIHDNRFDSTTTVDHIKNDVIAIELTEQQPQSKEIYNPFAYRIKRLGETIRLLPANVLAVVFISLIGGLIVSAILIIIII